MRDYQKDLDQLYFVTAYMNGISFQGDVESEDDLIIASYPIASGNSSLSIRTDAYQQRAETGKVERVISSQFLMAARSKETRQKYLIPQIDLNHSDNPKVATQRAELAKEA